MTTPRTALVTGANRGLGRASALRLAQDGLDVVITYRSNDQEAKEVVAALEDTGVRAAALRLDTTDVASFAAFADALRGVLSGWGRDTLDVLVNNAGTSGWTPVGETDVAEVQRLLSVHVTGTVMLTEALLPLIADGGSIVNTGTGLDRFTGDSGYSVYAAAKGAVEVYTRYLAKAVAARRITANVVAPGPTATDFAGGVLRDDEGVRGHLASVVAMGRVGEPDEIGAVVSALASERMRWVTGQRVEASGGMLL